MQRESLSVEYPLGEPMRGTKWVVRGKLGQGGMGVVLDVVKANLIPGAMKVLHPSFAKLPEFAERFLEEVRVTARLQHPNIVQVLDFDRLADGTPFMVMERLRGRTLRAALRETRQRGKIWSPANTYAVAAQVCEGLSRAHTLPIVHRDVKPENIYLHRTEGSQDSVVKIMDFGVAAVVGQRDRNQIGTPRYMAPEQLMGDRVSPQTDQYALGLVIYEMLTGRLPWDVDVRDVSAMVKVHVLVAPMPPSTFCAWLPERIDAAILRALSKQPGARHENLHQLLFELRALQSSEQAPTSTADVHSTDPMVGTLSEGFASAKDDPDTLGEMSTPPLEGHVASVPELTSGFEIEFSQGSEDGPQDSRARHGEAQMKAVAAGRADSPSVDVSEHVAANGVAVRAQGLKVAPGSEDTPMTGQSWDPAHAMRGIAAPWPLQRLRKALVGGLIAAGGVALLVATTRPRLVQRVDTRQPLEARHGPEDVGRDDAKGSSAALSTGGQALASPLGLFRPSDPAADPAGSARNAAEVAGRMSAPLGAAAAPPSVPDVAAAAGRAEASSPTRAVGAASAADSVSPMGKVSGNGRPVGVTARPAHLAASASSLPRSTNVHYDQF
jgi:serine/threonine protein kinase